MRLRALILVLGLFAISCGAGPTHGAISPDPPRTSAVVTSTTSLDDPEQIPSFEPAPAVVVSNGGAVLALDPWSACWTTSCYDGAPPDEPPNIGAGDELIIDFPVAGWTFQATARPVAGDCGRRQTQDLIPIDATRHRLTPIGPAGNHLVDLFGRGPGGDVIVTIAWTTTTDGPAPVPMATTSILADHDGIVDSYGVELSLWNLAHTPKQVAAEATITAADGASHTLVFTDQGDMCSVGSLFLSAPIEEGLAAAQLGDGPFIYEIRVTMDGLEFLGTGEWPTDEDPECAPCIPLSFDPPLDTLESVPLVEP